MNDRITIPIWSIGSFLVVMNTTMFNVSLPNIMTDLGITAGPGSWIVSGYSVVFALSTIIFSRLSDSIPIRKLLVIGLGLLGISSVIGYLANRFEVILFARLLQACGAGAMPGLGMVLASRYVPLERRGRAISTMASGSALAFGLGPVIGGAITQFFGWHGLFLVICLVMLLIPLLWKLLPAESPREVQFDFLGAFLTAVASASLLIALTRLSALFFLIGLTAVILTLSHLRKKEKPFIYPALFLHSGYRKLVYLAFSAFVLNMSILFLMPLVLSALFHKQAASIGMSIFPGAIVSAVLMNVIGRLIDRHGNFRFLLGGHLIIAISLSALSALVNVSPFVVMLAYLLFAPSLSTVTSSLSHEVSQILPEEMIGSGMGLLQLSQYMGGSFAVAICGLLLGWQKEVEASLAFRHIFFLLLAVLLGSLAMVVRYRKSRRVQSQTLHS